MARRKAYKPNPVLVFALGWLIPGAGQACIGRPLRGVIIFLVIGATFWAGVGMGGALTVDSRVERWWFVSEMFAGVHGLVGWYRQHRIYSEVESQLPPQPPARSKALAISQHQYAIDDALAERRIALVYPTDVVARAYAGIAGLLNLLCAFDATALALMGVHGEPRRRPKETPA